MKRVMAGFLIVFFILIILFLISLPFVLSFKQIHNFTEIERILLNIIIAGFAVFHGFLISRVNDKSIKKWKSAFISACDSLITTSAQTQTVRESHNHSRKKIEEYMPDRDDTEMNNLLHIFELKCHSCGEHMDHLKTHIDSSIDHLENMIDSFCDEPYCSQIHEAIDHKKQKIGMEHYQHNELNT